VNKNIIFPTLAFVALGVLVSSYKRSDTSLKEPNVILILTDDQGSIDLNCYGAEDLTTPNLDKLASEGVRFTQFYVGSAICSASRSCLLTGRTPQAAGVPGNVPSLKGKPGMPTEQVSIAELMKSNGYTCGHVGKWHLGYTPETMPLGQGFDYSFGHMGGCIDNYSHFFYWAGPNRHDLWENGKEIYRDGAYFPNLVVEKAKAFIDDNEDNPFFLYVAMNTPHYPLQATKKWRAHYKDLKMPRRDYAGFVSTTDEKIGEIIDYIDHKDLAENTIIIYLSDHGHSYEERTGNGGGNSGIYRGGKFSLFEGGLRVPAIIRWKGQIDKGMVRDQVCLSRDILPTIADYCNIKNVPEGVSGKSIKSTISSSHEVHKDEVLLWQLGEQWAVRKGSWKLVGNPMDPSPRGKNLKMPDDHLFLTNLDNDVAEKINVAKQNQEKLNELIKYYQEWEYSNDEFININDE